MKKKQLVGIGTIVLGVVLITFSILVKSKVIHAQQEMNEVSSFFPKDKVSSAVENKIHSKLSSYDMMIRTTMIGGIILSVVGIYIVFRFRKH